MSELIPGLIMGFREGLEAFLVIGIILRYLTKIDQTVLNRRVFQGTMAGVACSVGLGVGLHAVSDALGGVEKLTKVWESVASLAAVLLVTTFIIWMIRHGHQMAAHVKDRVAGNLSSVGVFLVSFMQIPVFLAASAIQVLQPGIEPADRVMVVAFLEHVPALLGGVGLAALMAAIMSTASTLFVLAGFGLSRDLYENLKSDEISEKHRMTVSRLAQGVIGLVVAVIAIARPAAIYWISIYAGAIFAVGWLPTVVAGLEWKRMNHKAALASMSIGVASFISVSEFVKRQIISLPSFLDPLMVSFALAVISLLIVALLTQPDASETKYFQELKSTSASSKTIENFLARPDGVTELKREYRNVQVIMVTLVAFSLALWGYLLVNLAF